MPIIAPLMLLAGGLLILLALAALVYFGDWIAALVLGGLGLLALSALVPPSDEQKQDTINDLANGGFFDD